MKNNYVVRVLGLPEHEWVILKLIFSISEKSERRTNTYTLARDVNEPADIVIRDAATAYTASVDVQYELLVMDVPSAAIKAPVILRPLIATRVLAVLDDVFAASRSGSSVVLPFTALQPAAPAIAEQSQEHPANRAAAGIPASQGAHVAAVIDSVLLSDPVEEPQRDIFIQAHESLEQAEASSPPAPAKPRVLIVDDSPAVCKQLEIELLQFAVVIDCVPSARKAIEMIGKYQYTLAFLDIVLPDWDGFKICKHIKSKAPHTTVVMLTDKATTGDKLRGALSGCDAYLIKPVGRQTFQEMVKKYLPLATPSRALGA